MARYIYDKTNHVEIPITGDPDPTNFVGTLSQWESLTQVEKNQYDSVDLTDDYYDIMETIGVKLSPQTLDTGSTTLVFEDPFISTDSVIDIYTSIYGLAPTNVSVTTGQITLTFDAQGSPVSVFVIVR